MVNQRLLVSANTPLHVCDISTSCRHYDDNCNSMQFIVCKLLISENRPCRSHRYSADTNQTHHVHSASLIRLVHTQNFCDKFEGVTRAI